MNNSCVEPPPSTEIPSEYIQVNSEDYYYVSQQELSWPQAQYECITRKGYLAEFNGMFFYNL